MSISKVTVNNTTHDIVAGGITYCTCDTSAATAAKVATVVSGNFSLFTGATVVVKFANANSATNPTLNVANTGAKSIYWHGSALSSSQYWVANSILEFVYNGSQWELVSVTETDPTVPSWAKQATKPSYTASEVGALPSSTVIPSKTSQLTNDSGFITGYTETDPTVPAWAKAASKPSYTANEVGAIPTSASCNKNWNWSGQGGQPSWLWGGNDGTNMYVYNPSNFSVNYATTAHGLQTYSASGSSHGGAWILNAQHNRSGDGLFRLYCGDGSIGVSCNRADVAGNADTVDGWHMNLDPGSYGIKAIAASTGDITPGATGLSNGYIYLVYE